MANRLTTTPGRPVPALGRLATLLLPFADAFLFVTWSRPQSGSLRSTWLTPATIALAVAVCPLLVTAAVLLLRVHPAGAGVVQLTASVLCGLGALGAAAVAIVGFDQRRDRSA